jgi:hypothetical protein
MGGIQRRGLCVCVCVPFDRCKSDESVPPTPSRVAASLRSGHVCVWLDHPPHVRLERSKRTYMRTWCVRRNALLQTPYWCL